MDNNKAFTAGVRIGGLTDRTEIKILLCYLLSSLKFPITSDQLTESISGQELVNYFELQDALHHLVSQNLILEENGFYSILPQGEEIACQLEKSLPFSVKERAYNAAVQLLQYESLKKENRYEISPLEGGGYLLKCSISDGDFPLFSIELYMPDEKLAKISGEQFILKGQDIFKCVLGITTDSPDMYMDFLKQASVKKED
ncbi:MAG: DUF4364 family protein [Oscillospiraceae bacterium]